MMMTSYDLDITIGRQSNREKQNLILSICPWFKKNSAGASRALNSDLSDLQLGSREVDSFTL